MDISKVLSKGQGYIVVEMEDGSVYKRHRGSVSWRCNNPGNLKHGKFTEARGAIGKDYIGHAVFPNLDLGIGAQYMLLFSEDSKYYDLTLLEAISRYAPTYDGNEPSKYANYIARNVDITTDTYLKDLDEDQRQEMLKYMRIMEGYVKGIETLIT